MVKSLNDFYHRQLTLQTRTGTFANSVDPDEITHDQLSHQDLLCQSVSNFVLTAVFATLDMPNFSDGRVH